MVIALFLDLVFGTPLKFHMVHLNFQAPGNGDEPDLETIVASLEPSKNFGGLEIITTWGRKFPQTSKKQIRLETHMTLLFLAASGSFIPCESNHLLICFFS